MAMENIYIDLDLEMGNSIETRKCEKENQIRLKQTNTKQIGKLTLKIKSSSSMRLRKIVYVCATKQPA